MDKLFKIFNSLLLAFCIVSPVDTAQAASKETIVKTGNALFASGKFDEAIRTYDEAAVDDPESPVIYFNKGAALYKKGDFAAARDAFGQAAIKTKDISLEAKSKFNLGLCFFQEGEHQKDSDLKKTLESYGSSVRSFQEALNLDPEFTEAAENIELVRLMMKSVLDEIKKKEEDARKQQEKMQQTAETIEELIEKQKNFLGETRSLINSDQPKNAKDTSPEETQRIADAQKQLKDDTRTLSDQLASQTAPAPNTASGASSGQGPAPNPEHPSKRHLDASIGEQENAISRLSDKDTHTAADHQQKSLDDLTKALDALSGDQKSQSAGQQQQEQKQQKYPDQENEQQQQEQNESNQGSAPAAEKTQTPEQPPPDQNQPSGLVLPDDANNILNEEKENQKQRMPLTSGGFKKVDKDW